MNVSQESFEKVDSRDMEKTKPDPEKLEKVFIPRFILVIDK